MQVMGDPQDDICSVAALNRVALANAIVVVRLPGDVPNSLVQAAHLGLVWCSARMLPWLKAGHAEDWTLIRGMMQATPETVTTTSIEESVLQTGSRVDQTDESQLLHRPSLGTGMVSKMPADYGRGA